MKYKIIFFGIVFSFLLVLPTSAKINSKVSYVSPINKILKSYTNFHNAKTYVVSSRISQKTDAKFNNKQDQLNFDNDAVNLKMINSVTDSELRFDKTKTDNIKSYNISKQAGGLMDGVSVQTVKLDGDVYERLSTSSLSSAKWKRSKLSIGDIFGNVAFNKTTDDVKNTDVIEYVAKNYRNSVSFKKAPDSVVQGKNAEHYTLDLKTTLARKIYASYLKYKNANSSFASILDKSVQQLDSIKFDLWIEKGSGQLIQHNILLKSSVKDATSLMTVSYLDEVTYKSIDMPLNIYAPTDFVDGLQK